MTNKQLKLVFDSIVCTLKRFENRITILEEKMKNLEVKK